MRAPVYTKLVMHWRYELMLVADNWKDYELIDAGYGERLERWGSYILRRPDPQVIWPPSMDSHAWEMADAWYHRSRDGGGRWEYIRSLPDKWTISYKDLSFYISPTGFKHTGLFPEQSVNWDWIIHKIGSALRPVSILNLFAYTGGATVAAAYGGAEVCHVDAARGMVARAKENIALSGLSERRVRFIVDDVIKFVRREIRRGRRYDGIIMDPPSYGRGPGGEVWKIEDKLFELVKDCMEAMSAKPLFFLINSYTAGFSPEVIKNMLLLLAVKKLGGRVTCGEIGIPISASGMLLPCGIYGRWEV